MCFVRICRAVLFVRSDVYRSILFALFHFAYDFVVLICSFCFFRPDVVVLFPSCRFFFNLFVVAGLDFLVS